MIPLRVAPLGLYALGCLIIVGAVFHFISVFFDWVIIRDEDVLPDGTLEMALSISPLQSDIETWHRAASWLMVVVSGLFPVTFGFFSYVFVKSHIPNENPVFCVKTVTLLCCLIVNFQLLSMILFVRHTEAEFIFEDSINVITDGFEMAGASVVFMISSSILSKVLSYYYMIDYEAKRRRDERNRKKSKKPAASDPVALIPVVADPVAPVAPVAPKPATQQPVAPKP